MKTHALRKYQDGVGSPAGRCFRCFRHDVAAQESQSTSTGTHDRGIGSEGMSSSLRCSTSRATGVFRSFLLRRRATARMQQRTVWVRQESFLQRCLLYTNVDDGGPTALLEVALEALAAQLVGNCSEWNYVPYRPAQVSLNRFVRPLGQQNCNLPIAPSPSAFRHL